MWKVRTLLCSNSRRGCTTRKGGVIWYVVTGSAIGRGRRQGPRPPPIMWWKLSWKMWHQGRGGVSMSCMVLEARASRNRNQSHSSAYMWEERRSWLWPPQNTAWRWSILHPPPPWNGWIYAAQDSYGAVPFAAVGAALGSDGSMPVLLGPSEYAKRGEKRWDVECRLTTPARACEISTPCIPCWFFEGVGILMRQIAWRVGTKDSVDSLGNVIADPAPIYGPYLH